MNKILIVEDEEHLRNLIAELLSSNKNEVIVKENPLLAIEYLESCDKKMLPNIIVSDEMMPEMSGFDFCKTLQKHKDCKKIPFVFLTGRILEEDEIQGLKIGAIDYIKKPFQPKVFLSKINNILETTLNYRVIEENFLFSEQIIEIFLLDSRIAILKKCEDIIHNFLKLHPKSKIWISGNPNGIHYTDEGEITITCETISVLTPVNVSIQQQSNILRLLELLTRIFKSKRLKWF